MCSLIQQEKFDNIYNTGVKPQHNGIVYKSTQILTIKKYAFKMSVLCTSWFVRSRCLTLQTLLITE